MTFFNKKKPQQIPEIKTATMPDHIQLGDHKLVLEPTGKWRLDGLTSSDPGSSAQVADLQRQVMQLQMELKDARMRLQAGAGAGTGAMASPGPAGDAGYMTGAQQSALQQQNLELRQENVRLAMDNSRLDFKVKVLLAMCTISEGDYQALCADAGVDPRTLRSQHTVRAV